MATLERIRQRSGLLLIVIGLAMLAFILTDLLGSGNSMLRNDANIVGEVDGSEIEIRDFNIRMDERLALIQQQNPEQAAGISRIMLADQIWREYQEEILLGGNYQDLGLAVNDLELFERITKNPQVRSQAGFKDQVTGQFSTAQLKQYIQTIEDNVNSDPQASAAFQQWINFENGTREEALKNKYLYAVRKGLYMPSALAKADYDRRNELSTIQYLGLEFSSIADSSISVSDGDLKSYYKKSEKDFNSDNTRDIAFVSFSVQPSDKDRQGLQSELTEYLQDQILTVRGRTDTLLSFANTKDDSSYAVGRSDLNVAAAFYQKEELVAPLDSILFEQEEGYIYGPYEDNGTYALAKISAITNIPDSVEARHILLSYQGAANGRSESTRIPQVAKDLADSILKVVSADSTQFGALAKKYSDDPGSGAIGGSLGWFSQGQMVEQFNKYSFYNESGSIGLVFSQFGFHIIHIQDQAGSNKVLKLVKIQRQIEASDATRDSIYNLASNFAAQANAEGADFAIVAGDLGYSARPAANIAKFQESILGIGQNREIVRWLHNEETLLGGIQLFNQDNNSFIVTQLTQIQPEGILPFEMVKEKVRPMVIKEKKAFALSEKLAAASSAESDLNALATSLEVQVKNQGINFATSNLTGFGNEPAIIGAATSLALNTISKPVIGERGVYLVSVGARVDAEALSGYESEQIRIETEMSNLAAQKIFESVMNSAEIIDNRPNFY
jgi:peptidyl-prolyl cis-trans isomerase D